MDMTLQIAIGLLVPLLGTTAGSACVFLLRDQLKERTQKTLLGFASGVMVAACAFSLLIPAIQGAEEMGKLAFLPAAIGTAAGFAFLLVLDHVIPHLHVNASEPEGVHGSARKLSRSTMLCLAVTLHNIPEGMAVGVVFAGTMTGGGDVSVAAAFALAVGLAIQNFPEGAVISMPLASGGSRKGRSFLMGMLSGVVEPVAALLVIALAGSISTLLPYLLSFAAGAMLYVVVEELIPEASGSKHSNHGTIGFALGFILMMILDVALG